MFPKELFSSLRINFLEKNNQRHEISLHLVFAGMTTRPCYQQATNPFVVTLIWTAGQRIDPYSKSTIVWKVDDDFPMNLTYSTWYSGEPSYYLSQESCLALSYNFLWNDAPCGVFQSHQYLTSFECVLCEIDMDVGFIF